MSMSELLEKVIDDQTKGIQTGMIGKIVSFTPATMRADVQPMLKIEDSENDLEIDYPVLADLPVMMYRGNGFIIKPSYATDDLVWLGFSTFDYQDALTGYMRLNSAKKVELHNAIVLGGITPDNFSGGAAFTANGVVVGSESGTPEAMLKGESFLSGLDSFLSTLSGLVGGTEAQNATAINSIASAASSLQGQLESFKSTDAKVT